MGELNELELLTREHEKGSRADRMEFQVDADRIQISGAVVRVGDSIKDGLRLLNLRRSRAETLTKRIHMVFCALAAARVHRPDGWVSVEEIGTLEGWTGDAPTTAKLLVNEFEIGSGQLGIVEQRGRGADIQLRLRMPPARIALGDLPDGVRRRFVPPRPVVAPTEHVSPQPIIDEDLAAIVAHALGAMRVDDTTLLVRPLYQGGHGSFVFSGLAIRPAGTAAGRSVATSVLVKIPVGLSASTVLAVHQEALRTEAKLLDELAGWPGLPARVERIAVDLRSIGGVLREKHGIECRAESLAMDGLVIPLGYPRTVEAEPRLLSGVIEETMAPGRRLTRRDIHNVLILADRLASLTRLLHRKRRAHRHLSVDAVVVRYELGILDQVLAADLAALVDAPPGIDDLLFRDLFDLGRVLVHVITGRRPSSDRNPWRPPGFTGRAQLKGAVRGEGETVARLLFAISRYLLEAAPWPGSDQQSESPTVRLLDYFLDEIEHIGMLHWSRARGVPERRVPLGTSSGAAFQIAIPPRESWTHSAADPVATRLVTTAHLVDVPTLRRWCDRYVTSFAHASIAGPGEMVGDAPAERCIAILQRGFGRSAAREMWTYLWEARRDEPITNLVRVLRNYVTHWIREQRFDVAHSFGTRRFQDRGESLGLRDELDALRGSPGAADAWIEGRPNRQLLLDWIDELDRRALDLDAAPGVAPPDDGRRDRLAAVGSDTDDAGETGRLKSWIHAGALRRLLRAKTIPPTEKDIHDVELALRGRSSPETVFWQILLARAWVSAAVHGVKPQAVDGESGWDKAMRTLLVAAGVAASRKLPFEMAATFSASAHLTRIALSAPELRAEFALQGVDEESARVQAAECALMAADAYLWLDNQKRHCRSVLEAAWLLLDSAFPERVIQSLQLISLARNNRVLDWQPPQLPDDEQDASAAAKFERYRPEPAMASDARAAELEDELFRKAQSAWADARNRIRTSDDPGSVVADGYFSRYASRSRDAFKGDCLRIDLEDHLLLELARDHYGRPTMRTVLDLGCGTGEDARRLAAHVDKVWAVDSPVWFAAREGGLASSGSSGKPTFIARDPVAFARQIADGHAAKDGPQPGKVDVVLFRGSLSRVSQRRALLDAAFELLTPGGLVVGTDWIQDRTTDRIMFSRLLSVGRFVDLGTRRGYEQLCSDARFRDFHGWGWDDVVPSDHRPMHRFFQRRLDDLRRALASERLDDPRSPYERAFLLRARRDLDVVVSAAGHRGPLGWLFWAARKDDTHPSG